MNLQQESLEYIQTNMLTQGEALEEEGDVWSEHQSLRCINTRSTIHQQEESWHHKSEAQIRWSHNLLQVQIYSDCESIDTA